MHAYWQSKVCASLSPCYGKVEFDVFAAYHATTIVHVNLLKSAAKACACVCDFEFVCVHEICVYVCVGLLHLFMQFRLSACCGQLSS